MKQSGNTMGMVIASLRKAQGMTQAELAEILEVSVEELMQGETRPASLVKRINEIVDLVLKALVVAMGIALVVCSVLKTLEPTSGFQLAGLGLASAGILFLRQDKGIR